MFEEDLGGNHSKKTAIILFNFGGEEKRARGSVGKFFFSNGSDPPPAREIQPSYRLYGGV